jgi:hypothetical protein
VFGEPFVTSPVTGSIIAVSDGGTSKEKTPPGVPLITMVAPSQVGVIVKDASSLFRTVTLSIDD